MYEEEDCIKLCSCALQPSLRKFHQLSHLNYLDDRMARSNILPQIHVSQASDMVFSLFTEVSNYQTDPFNTDLVNPVLCNK